MSMCVSVLCAQLWVHICVVFMCCVHICECICVYYVYICDCTWVCV